MERRVWIGVRTAIAFLLAAVFTNPVPAAAQVQVLLDGPVSEVVDTTIRGGTYGNINYADKTAIATRDAELETNLHRSLLKFNTESNIPEGATIASATLTLTIRMGNGGVRTLGVYRVTESFEEGTATWNNRKAAYEWGTPGGDLGAKYAQASVPATEDVQVTFDLTALVQASVNGDFGSRFTRVALVDIGGTGTFADSYREFYSSEAADASVRPRLAIEYVQKLPEPTPPPPPPPPPPPTAAKTTIRVLHWNTHQGKGTDGVYDLDRIGEWIVKFKPDIVTLNEVHRLSGTGNDDHPAHYAAMLKAATGQTWYTQFTSAGGNATGGGNAILSRFPITARSECALSTNWAPHASIDVNGHAVNVWVAHLPTGDGYADERVRSAAMLRKCAEQWSENRIINGDWNQTSTRTEVSSMTTDYFDSWPKAKSTGDAIDFVGNTRDGATHSWRIDYVFFSRGSDLTLKEAQVFSTKVDGVRPSDHKPLLVTFTLD